MSYVLDFPWFPAQNQLESLNFDVSVSSGFDVFLIKFEFIWSMNSAGSLILGIWRQYFHSSSMDDLQVHLSSEGFPLLGTDNGKRGKDGSQNTRNYGAQDQNDHNGFSFVMFGQSDL